MSKGSTPRPLSVAPDDFEERWKRTFVKTVPGPDSVAIAFPEPVPKLKTDE